MRAYSARVELFFTDEEYGHAVNMWRRSNPGDPDPSSEELVRFCAYIGRGQVLLHGKVWGEPPPIPTTKEQDGGGERFQFLLECDRVWLAPPSDSHDIGEHRHRCFVSGDHVDHVCSCGARYPTKEQVKP